MIFKDVRCVLTNWWLVAIGVVAYLVAVNAGAYGVSIDWLYLLLFVHFIVGLVKIALRNRPLGFGLANLVAEMSFLSTVAFASVIPVMMVISSSSDLARLVGQDKRQIYDGIPWAIIPIMFILIPTGLLCIATWAMATSYENEPVLE